ncbi:rhodanese-like domain-containing protein [bacterium]|nr:rhodanese-like domain-containing protein [bacterium]
MMRMRHTIIQMVVIWSIGIAVAFSYNAFSDKGINPFIKIVYEESMKTPVSEEGEGIVLIDLKQLRELSRDNMYILDASTEDDYREGHIPGAILFDFYQFETYADRVLPLIDPEGDIIVYCSSPFCDSSSFLATELYSMGYFNIYLYKDGFSNWQDKGLPVEKGLQ